MEVNGRVHTRLAADKTNMTLTKCKSGIKYTCVLVAVTGPEGMDACQRKVKYPILQVFQAAVLDSVPTSVAHPLPGSCLLPRLEYSVRPLK